MMMSWLNVRVMKNTQIYHFENSTPHNWQCVSYERLHTLTTTQIEKSLEFFFVSERKRMRNFNFYCVSWKLLVDLLLLILLLLIVGITLARSLALIFAYFIIPWQMGFNATYKCVLVAVIFHDDDDDNDNLLHFTTWFLLLCNDFPFISIAISYRLVF